MIDFTDKMFDAVQPGAPGFFKTREHGVSNVRRVVRDGSGCLWTSEVGSGVRLTDLEGLDAIAPIECLAPVEAKCPHDGPNPTVHRAFHEQVVEKLRAELELMRGTTYCAYCGARFELDAPDMSENVTKHIMTCDKHPMRAVEKERDDWHKLLDVMVANSAVKELVLEEKIEDLTAYARKWEDRAEVYRAHAIKDGDEVKAAHAVLTDGNWPAFDEHEQPIPLPLRVRMAMAPTDRPRAAGVDVFGVALGDHLETLRAMAAVITTQDNRCTAEPIYVVQQRKRIYGLDPDNADGSPVVWIDLCNDGAEIGGDEARDLEAAYQETLEVPSEYSRTSYVDEWEMVQPFLTEAGAEAYIAANRHRMTDPRVYVDSAYRNREWQAIRALLRVFAADGLEAAHVPTPWAEAPVAQDERDHADCFAKDAMPDCAGDGWYRCAECARWRGRGGQ